MTSWRSFLVLIIVCLSVQGFYAMLEMACVSFNKVRLQYFVSKNHMRARWLNFLLHHPARLFGTTPSESIQRCRSVQKQRGVFMMRSG